MLSAMWVCHCLGIRDREVRDAVLGGARDEAGVAAMCGAGSRCGGCQDEVRRILVAAASGAR